LAKTQKDANSHHTNRRKKQRIETRAENAP